jgi:hypothetical protein
MVDCGNEFVFTEGEQNFYREKVSKTNRNDARNAENRKTTKKTDIDFRKGFRPCHTAVFY